MTIIWLGFFASIFFGWYFYLQARNKERMALIERNVDVTEIYKKREIHFRLPWLKLGLTILGVGIGILVGPIFYYSLGEPRLSMGAFVIGSMMIFGSLGLLIAYFIEKR